MGNQIVPYVYSNKSECICLVLFFSRVQYFHQKSYPCLGRMHFFENIDILIYSDPFNYSQFKSGVLSHWQKVKGQLHYKMIGKK